MLRWQAYKFELMPNGEQVRNMRQFAGSCRFVYNKALALNKERYEKKEKRLGYAGLCALLPAWKIEHPFLYRRTGTSIATISKESGTRIHQLL
jgi:transposase